MSNFKREEQGKAKSVNENNNIAQNIEKRGSLMLAMSLIKTSDCTILTSKISKQNQRGNFHT